MRDSGSHIYDEWVLWAVIAAIGVILFVALVFATLAIALRVLKGRRDARERYLRKLWIGPVLDCISNPRKHPFRHGIRRQDQLLFLEFLGRLSLSVSASEQDAVRLMARPYLNVIYDLLTDREAEFRALGIQLLGLLDPDRNRRHLLRGLRDKSPIVSLTAVRALARTGTETDVRDIIGELPRFVGWGTSMLTSLLVSCGQRAASPIRELLADPEANIKIRVAACDALRWMVDLPSVAIARELLLHQPNREITAACLRLIARLGLAEDAQLMSAFTTHDDWIIRLYAVSGMAALADPVHGEQVAMSLGDPSHWVAIRAAQGLHELRRDDLLRHIVSIGHPRAALARPHIEAA